MQLRPGLWKFINKATGAVITANVNDNTPSKIKAAFDTAVAALNPTSRDSIVMVDGSGREIRGNSIPFAKKW